MVSEIDSIIGYHCAPAIRGIKVANLVAIPRDMDLHLTTALSAYNEKFNDRGLFFYELCHCDRRRFIVGVPQTNVRGIFTSSRTCCVF